MHLDPTTKFPESKEKPGHFVGFAETSGDALTHKILKDDLKTVLVRSVVRPADTLKNRNRRVIFKDEVEDELNKPDEDFKHNTPLKPAEAEDPGDECADVPELIKSSSSSDDEDQGIHTRTRSKKRTVGAVKHQLLQNSAKTMIQTFLS